MAEYVKFRWTSAKVGVSMALLALIAGAADKAQAATNRATASSPAQFLKLVGLTGTIASDFNKVDKQLVKLTKVITSVEDKWFKVSQNLSRNYYKESKIDSTFEKIANANGTFLKITDAALKYLKFDGTAADSSKLGGLPASAFLQGKGNLLSNALVASSANQVLLGDGSVRVLIGLDQASGKPSVTLENDTNASLNFTFTGGVFTGNSNTLAPNGGTAELLPAVQSVDTGAGGQLNIQIFSAGGGGGAGKVWTATVSTEKTGAGQQFVGQLLIGLL